MQRCLRRQKSSTTVLTKDSTQTTNPRIAPIKNPIDLLVEKKEVILDIDQNKKKIISLVAYPNPFDGVVNIEFHLKINYAIFGKKG